MISVNLFWGLNACSKRTLFRICHSILKYLNGPLCQELTPAPVVPVVVGVAVIALFVSMPRYLRTILAASQDRYPHIV